MGITVKETKGAKVNKNNTYRTVTCVICGKPINHAKQKGNAKTCRNKCSNENRARQIKKTRLKNKEKIREYNRVKQQEYRKKGRVK